MLGGARRDGRATAPGSRAKNPEAVARGRKGRKKGGGGRAKANLTNDPRDHQLTLNIEWYWLPTMLLDELVGEAGTSEESHGPARSHAAV